MDIPETIWQNGALYIRSDVVDKIIRFGGEEFEPLQEASDICEEGKNNE